MNVNGVGEASTSSPLGSCKISASPTSRTKNKIFLSGSVFDIIFKNSIDKYKALAQKTEASEKIRQSFQGELDMKELDMGGIYKNSETCPEEHDLGMGELSEDNKVGQKHNSENELTMLGVYDPGKRVFQEDDYMFDDMLAAKSREKNSLENDLLKSKNPDEVINKLKWKIQMRVQFVQFMKPLNLSNLLSQNQKPNKNERTVYAIEYKRPDKKSNTVEISQETVDPSNLPQYTDAENVVLKNENLEMAAEDASTALATSQSKIEELTSENKTLNTKITALESQLKEVNAGNTGLTSQLEKVNAENEGLKKGQATKDTRINSLKKEAGKELGIKKDLLKAHDDLSKQLENVKVRSAQDLASTQEANNQLSQEITSLKDQLADNESKIETLTQAKNELDEKVESTLSETETIKLAHSVVKVELDSTQKKLGTLTEENNSLNKENADLKADNAEKNININDLEARVKKLEDEKQILEAEKARLESDLKTETGKVNNLTEENQSLAGKNTKLEAENARLTTQLAEAKQKIDEVQAESKQLQAYFEREIQDLQNYRANLDDSIRNLYDQIAEKEAQVGSARQGNQILQDKNDRLEENVTQLNTQLTDLKQQLQTAEHEKNNVASELDQLQQQFEASEKRVGAANTQIATLQKELTSSSFKIQNLTQALEAKDQEILALHLNANNNQIEIDGLNNQVRDLETQLASTQEYFRLELDNLNQKLADMRTYNHELQEKLNNAQIENQVLQSTLLTSGAASSSPSSSSFSFAAVNVENPVLDQTKFIINDMKEDFMAYIKMKNNTFDFKKNPLSDVNNSEIKKYAEEFAMHYAKLLSLGSVSNVSSSSVTRSGVANSPVPYSNLIINFLVNQQNNDKDMTTLRLEIKNNLNHLMEKISDQTVKDNLKLFASCIDDTGKLKEGAKELFSTDKSEDITKILQDAFDENS